MLELQHVGVASQMSKIPECYADCLPYLVDKASVYLRLYGSVFLHKAKSDLTLEQFITLDAIANTPNICQRDLAKIILKDRSNVTRILSILENKGYIERLISVKNNRPVKILKLKPKGQKVITQISPLIKNDLEMLMTQFDKDELQSLRNTLEKIILKISEKANIQI